MKNLGQLYGFEIKKIMKNRLTVAMLVVTVIFILIEAFVPKITMTKEMMDAQKVLDGRVIDDTLLQEMYPKLAENGRLWNATNNQYEEIADMEIAMLPDGAILAEYSADEMYKERKEAIISFMKLDELTDAEIAWWENEIPKTETPFTYRFFQGALNLAQGMSLTLMCIMLIAALCLSTVFTVEHRQRTDQLVLCCRNGRKETFFTKIAAGLSVVLGCCLVSAALLTLLIVVLYGLNGLNSVVQLELPWAAYPFTFGEFIAVQMIVMFSAAILFAAFAMAMSEIVKNSLAVMGIMVCIFIFGQLEIIPPNFRVLAQMKSMIPSNQISIWSLLEYRLIGFGGNYITTYVASPLIYLAISVLLIIIGKISYDRFQVTGR
jgi:hypothetical protein